MQLLPTTNYKLPTLPRMMLVDMNSFFASVEQQANPFLRGKPLGVANNRVEGACLIGTSKEAKALGIKNGIPLYKARKIYPKIMVVPAEPEKYREVSRAINKIFRDYTDRVEPYSVDESFLNLDDQNPLIVGSQIKERIKREVGEWLTCSVGIAENKFLCKLAADMSTGGGSASGGENSDNLGILWRSQLRNIYTTKKLSDLWGISHGWTNRLQKLGINSPLQLLDYPVANLVSLYGKPGYWIWQRVNGLEVGDEASRNSYQSSDNPKSFGQSWVLNFRTTDKERLKSVILRLAEKAARRMRKENFQAYGVYLSIRMTDGNGFHRGKKLKFGISTGLELYKQALEFWKQWKLSAEVMHIAVGFNYLAHKTNQLQLFPNKQAKLTPTLDFINNKYGEFTVRSGLLTKTSDYAPDSIAFGK